MQFLKAQPLIKKFKSGNVKDLNIAPYFIVSTLLTTVASSDLAYKDDQKQFLPIEVYLVFIFIVATINLGGLLYLRFLNGGNFHNDFLYKWFSLGWVASIRAILIMTIALVGLGFIFGILFKSGLSEEEKDFVAYFMPLLISNIFVSIYYYWQLGQFLKETLRK